MQYAEIFKKKRKLNELWLNDFMRNMIFLIEIYIDCGNLWDI